MNNESGALVNLPLPLPQPQPQHCCSEKGPPGSQPAGPAFTPTLMLPACPPPCSSSLGLAQAWEWRTFRGKGKGFQLGSGVGAADTGSHKPEIGSQTPPVFSFCLAPACFLLCQLHPLLAQRLAEWWFPLAHQSLVSVFYSAGRHGGPSWYLSLRK